MEIKETIPYKTLSRAVLGYEETRCTLMTTSMMAMPEVISVIPSDLGQQ